MTHTCGNIQVIYANIWLLALHIGINLGMLGEPFHFQQTILHHLGNHL